MSDLRAPFPWFGGKSRVAHLVWDAFGDVPNYVEPFAGSLAVLLGRPGSPRIETVNDLDCYLANAWRAIQLAPDEVAKWCDWPVNEADLHARHFWLVNQAEFRERMLSDPGHYDAKIAGWWIWGLSAWLGSGWCDIPRTKRGGGRPHRKIINTSQCGVHRAGNSRASAAQEWESTEPPDPVRRERGPGSASGGGHPSRQLPHMLSRKGIHSQGFGGSFDALSARLRRVRVCCGDWSRVLTDSVTIHVGDPTGVFLDPPYADGDMQYAAGGAGSSLSADVRAWAIEHGEDKRLRIALCGYEGEHAMPESWRCVPWKAKGGYGNTRKDGTNENAGRERIWFSPHCLGSRQRSLFGTLDDALRFLEGCE